MIIAELKAGIREMLIKNPEDIAEEMYNEGINFCLKMIGVYERFQEPEYPLGRNDWQE